jgi:hypothetical protein
MNNNALEKGKVKTLRSFKLRDLDTVKSLGSLSSNIETTSIQNIVPPINNIYSRNYTDWPTNNVLYRLTDYDMPKGNFKRYQEVYEKIYITRINDGVWGIGRTPFFNIVKKNNDIDNYEYNLEILQPLIVNVDVSRPGEWGGRFRFEIDENSRTSLSFETDATDGWVQNNQYTLGQLGLEFYNYGVVKTNGDIFTESSQGIQDGYIRKYKFADPYVKNIKKTISHISNTRTITQNLKNKETEIGYFYGIVFGVYITRNSYVQREMWINMRVSLVFKHPEIVFTLNKYIIPSDPVINTGITKRTIILSQYLYTSFNQRVIYMIEPIENKKFNVVKSGWDTIMITSSEPGGCKVTAIQEHLINQYSKSSVQLFWDKTGSEFFFTLDRNISPPTPANKIKITERVTNLTQYLNLPSDNFIDVTYSITPTDNRNVNALLSGSIFTLTSSESRRCLLTALGIDQQYGYRYISRVELYWDEKSTGVFFSVDKLRITERIINITTTLKYLTFPSSSKISYNITPINDKNFNAVLLEDSNVILILTSSESGGCLLTAVDKGFYSYTSSVVLYWDKKAAGLFISSLDEIKITERVTTLTQYLNSYSSPHLMDVYYTIKSIDNVTFIARVSGSTFTLGNNESGRCLLTAVGKDRQYGHSYTDSVVLYWDKNAAGFFFISDRINIREGESAIINLPQYLNSFSSPDLVDVTYTRKDLSLVLNNVDWLNLSQNILDNSITSTTALVIEDARDGGCIVNAVGIDRQYAFRYTCSATFYWDGNVSGIYISKNKIKITERFTDISKYVTVKGFDRSSLKYILQPVGSTDYNYGILNTTLSQGSLSGSIFEVLKRGGYHECILVVYVMATLRLMQKCILYWDDTSFDMYFTENNIKVNSIKVKKARTDLSEYLNNKSKGFENEVLEYKIDKIGNENDDVVSSDVTLSGSILTIKDSFYKGPRKPKKNVLPPGYDGFADITAKVTNTVTNTNFTTRVRIVWDYIVSLYTPIYFSGSKYNLPFEINEILSEKTDISKNIRSDCETPYYNGRLLLDTVVPNEINTCPPPSNINYSIVARDGYTFNASLLNSILTINNVSSGGCLLLASQANYTHTIKLFWGANIGTGKFKFYFTSNNRDPVESIIFNRKVFVLGLVNRLNLLNYIYMESKSPVTFTILKIVSNNNINIPQQDVFLEFHDNLGGECVIMATSNGLSTTVKFSWTV